MHSAPGSATYLSLTVPSPLSLLSAWRAAKRCEGGGGRSKIMSFAATITCIQITPTWRQNYAAVVTREREGGRGKGTAATPVKFLLKGTYGGVVYLRLYHSANFIFIKLI